MIDWSRMILTIFRLANEGLAFLNTLPDWVIDAKAVAKPSWVKREVSRFNPEDKRNCNNDGVDGNTLGVIIPTPPIVIIGLIYNGLLIRNLARGMWAILRGVCGVVEFSSELINVVMSNLVILTPSPRPPAPLVTDSDAAGRSWGSGVRRGEEGERGVVDGWGEREGVGMVEDDVVVVVVSGSFCPRLELTLLNQI